MNKSMESYEVKGARLYLDSVEEDTKIVKGEFRPKFGFNTRYTIYDLDENENEIELKQLHCWASSAEADPKEHAGREAGSITAF